MKYVVTVLVITLGLIISVPLTAYSANITYNDNQITISGRLVNGDYKQLQRVVDRTGIKSVRLKSNGGSAIEGYQLGYTIHRNLMSTVVRKGDVCLSACAVAFLGGVHKYNYGVLGFHVAWAKTQGKTFNDGMKVGQMFGSIDSIYLFNMGYTAQLNLLIPQLTTKDNFLVVDSEDLKSFEMIEKDFTKFIDLSNKWAADRIYEPYRLHLLTGMKK